MVEQFQCPIQLLVGAEGRFGRFYSIIFDGLVKAGVFLVRIVLETEVHDADDVADGTGLADGDFHRVGHLFETDGAAQPRFLLGVGLPPLVD